MWWVIGRIQLRRSGEYAAFCPHWRGRMEDLTGLNWNISYYFWCFCTVWEIIPKKTHPTSDIAIYTNCVWIHLQIWVTIINIYYTVSCHETPSAPYIWNCLQYTQHVNNLNRFECLISVCWPQWSNWGHSYTLHPRKTTVSVVQECLYSHNKALKELWLRRFVIIISH